MGAIGKQQSRSDSDSASNRAQRHDRILDRLRTCGGVLVGDLAADLTTSEMTIRRDLKAMESEGLVRRIHGGALLVPSRAYEPGFREKSRQFVDEKRRIGAAAAAQVESGDTLILSPGTTTWEVARHLKGVVRNVTLITTAVSIAGELASEAEIDVIVIGGRMRGTTYALVGAVGEETLRRLHVTKLFLGGNGLTVANGLTTSDLSVAATDRALVRAAERVIVTVDHSKIGRTALCKTAPIDRIHTLITDSGIRSADYEALTRAGVQVVVA